MPWQLTTPVDVGDLDSVAYSQIRIVRMAHDSVRKIIVVDLEYGNTVNDVWQPGIAPRTKPISIFIQEADYNTLVGTSLPEDAEELVYEAVKRHLYNYLLNKAYIGPGELVA